MNNKIESTCCICGKEIQVDSSGYKRGIEKDPDDPKFYCSDCIKQLRSDQMKKYSWDTMTPEQQEERREKIKIINDNKSLEEKLKKKNRVSEAMKEYWATMDKDERSRLIKNRFYSNRHKQTMTEEQVEKFNEIRESLNYNNNILKKLNDYSEQKGPNEIHEDWRNDRKITHDQKLIRDSIERDLLQTLEKSNVKLSYEDLLNIKEYIKNNYGSEATSVSEDKIKSKFESYFDASYISNMFYIKRDELCKTKEYEYLWNYGIYNKDTNNLEMVLDIERMDDDNYDEAKFTSVPVGIKYHIIFERDWKRSFEDMIKILMGKTYDEFILNMFAYCRTMPFPYLKYPTKMLLKSYKDLLRMDVDPNRVSLSLNTRHGDNLINHFHESIMHARRKGSKYSPYEAYYNDDILIETIKNRIIYVPTINPTRIIQGFNISKKAQKVSVFAAGRAKLIINKYLSEYNTIFDPFSGFSGRMLGALSLNKNYIGQDISPIHQSESMEIVNFLSDYYPDIKDKVRLYNIDITKSSGEYECLFTCPPYSDKEIWIGVAPDERSCDDWIDICLNNFKCKRYVFVIDKTYKYQKYVVHEIINKSHFGSNSEYIVLIDQ